jgi:hypothetical protein
MDFVGPFPEVNGYNYLWVVICHMINMVHPYTGEHQDDSLAAVVDLLERSCLTSWIACEYHIRPRLEVHLQVVAGASSVDGRETLDVDVVPSANGWHNRMS